MHRWILSIFLLVPLSAQSAVESQVLQKIRQMMSGQGGRVTFSTLINEPSFNQDQKALLKRLYEVFFQIPTLLKSEYDRNGKAPSRQQMADNFGLSATSVDLLLAVMKSDPRVPKMFDLDPSSREIAQVYPQAVEGFLQSRPSQMKLEWASEKLPQFSLKTLDGGKVSNGDLDGPATLVYFWFTGCPPCGRISPHLVDLDAKYRARGFKIVGINADEVLQLGIDNDRRNSYLKRKEVRYVNAHLDESTRQAFGGVNIFPTLFFVDGEGTIVAHYINYQDMATLEGTVRKLLGL